MTKCQHCDAEVFSQPNRMGTTPSLAEAVKNYFAVWDRCGGSEAVDAGEFANARQDMRAALAATPAVGGEALEENVAWAILEALHDDVPIMDRPQSWSDLNGNHEKKIRRAAKAAIALAAQPASPLRGRESFDAWFNSHFLDPDGGSNHLPDWLKDDLRSAWDAALASPPEQPAAAPVTEWQPIETAPRNGRDILVSCGFGEPTRIAFWDDARGGIWSLWPGRKRLYYPRHWMPLPTVSDREPK